MAEIAQLQHVIDELQGSAFYPPVAIDLEIAGSDHPYLICANGHRWMGIDLTNGCGTCKRNHEFRLKGRTDCEEPGCHELVTCSDRAWDDGIRKCQHHWIQDGEYEVGPVSCDDTIAILAQYNPRYRWNGWLGAPYFDAWSVVTFIDDLNQRMDTKGPADMFGYEWEERDGEWVLLFTDPYAQETEDAEQYVPEVYAPDEDGLYTFGNGWVWYEDRNYGSTPEWMEWEGERNSLWVNTSNENNSRLISEGVDDRHHLNEAAANKVVAAWLEDNPEPPKYGPGREGWTDLTGRVTE